MADEIKVDHADYIWNRELFPMYENPMEFMRDYGRNDPKTEGMLAELVADFNNSNPEFQPQPVLENTVFDAKLAPESEFITLKIVRAWEAEERYFAERRHWRPSDFPE